MVDLAAVGGADVKPIAVVLVQVFQHIGAGTDRLGLYGLQRPLPAHLVTDHAVDIVLQLQHVDHCEVTPGPPVVLEPAPVLIAGEPGAGLRRIGDIRENAQSSRLSTVVLEQNPIGACLYHIHPVGACIHHSGPLGQAGQGRLGLRLGAVGSRPHLIGPIDPGHKAAVIPAGLRLGRFIVVAAGNLDVIAPHQYIAGDRGRISLFSSHGAPIEILGFQHRHLDGARIGAGQLHKVQAAVEAAEAIAAAVPLAVVVLQMGGLHLPGGHMGVRGGQPHPDHHISIPVDGRRSGGGNGQVRRKKRGGKLHKSFSHNVLHFSGFLGVFLLTTWRKTW